MYDGERYLGRALDSLLGQTLTDLELVISDNASNDRTRAIARDPVMALANAQSGVTRLDTLRRTPLDRPHPSGDMALMAELARYGKFRVLPEVLRVRRQSAATSSSLLSHLESSRRFNPAATAPARFVRRRRHHGRVPVGEKLRVYPMALPRARWNRVRLRDECRTWLGGRGAAA